MRRLFLYLFIATISFLSYSQPVISNADWFDQNSDGQIDQVVLTFDVNVDITDATAAAGSFDVILINGGAITFDDNDYSNANQPTLTLNFTGNQLNTTSISGLTVTYQPGASSIVNAGGATEVLTGEVGANGGTYSDSAAPQIVDFRYEDNDSDAQIDQFVVSFSEALDAASVLSANDLLFTNDGDFDGALFGTNNSNLLGAGGETNVTVVLGTASTVTDTEENSGAIAVNTQNTFSLTDGTNTNATLGAQGQATFSDGAAPQILDFEYEDNDADGQIDQFVITFSEILDAASTLSANDLTLTNVGDFTSAAFGADATDLVTAAAANVTVPLGTESTIGDTEENSGTIAISSQNAFSITDGTNINNTLGAQSLASFSDGAAPQITDFEYGDNDADGRIDQFIVSFSEALDAASVLSANDLSFSNDGDFDGALFGPDATDLVVAAVSNVTVVLGTESTVVDTEENSAAIAVNTLNGFSLTDGTNVNATLGAQSQATFSDGAAPQITDFQYLDNDLDGQIDRFVVSFSEALDAASVLSADDLLFTNDGDFDGALFGTNTTNLLGSGGETNVTVVLGTASTVADTEENSGTIAINTQNAFSLTDGTNTNATLGAQGQATFSDGAGPVIISAVTSDNNLNGQIDRMTLTFSENIDDGNSGIFDNTTVDVAGYVGEAKVSGDDDNAEVIISFTESGSGDTGATPNVTLLFGQVEDASTISIGSSQVFSGTTDGAAPQITDFEYQDNDNDGMIDQLALSFSETLDAASVLSANDLIFTNDGDFDGALFGADATDLVTGAISSVTVVLGTASTVVDTEENSAAIAVNTQNAFSLTDGTNINNTLGAQGQATFTDGAGPVILSAVTSDNDLDGQIDRITLTFSENIDDGNSGVFDNTTVNVAGYAGETKVSGDDDNAEVIISFTESGSGDTGATPSITLQAGQVEDGLTNSIAGSQVFAGTTDGAAPRITNFEYEDNDADGRIDQFIVSFSETLDAASVLSANDLSFSNDGDFDGALFGPDATDLVVAAVSNVTVVLGTASTVVDTEENSAAIAVNTLNGFSLTDGTNVNATLGAQSQATFSDGAAPQITDFQYLDNDLDGQIDRFVVSFSEALDAASVLSADDLLFTNDGDFDGALFGTNTTNLLGSGGETNVTVVLGTASTVADTEENSGTIAINTQNAFSLTDGTNTNATLGAQGQATFSDGAGPVIISAVTSDNNLNGQIDRMTLTFSENIDDGNSGIFDNTTVDVAGYVGEAKVSGDDDNAEVIISFTESGSGDTGATPNVTLLFGQVEDASTISIGSSQVFSGTTDGAAPQITDFEYQDNDNDGMIDQLALSFSETLDAASVLSANDLIFTNDGDFDGALFGADATDLVTGAISSVTVVLGTASTVVDTEENSAAIAVNTQNAFSLTDGTNINNTLGAQGQATFTDGAAPIVADLEIFDTTVDGFIDRIDITFSENIDTDDGAAPATADLGTLTLPDGETVSNAISIPVISDPAGGTNIVSVTGIADQLAENTGIGSLDIDGLTGRWEDATGNAIIAAGDDFETLTDGANPALVSSFPADNSASFPPASNITLTFSEDVVFGSGNIDLNNITTPASSVSYDVTSAPELSLATNTVTIDPASDLTLTNEYAIQIAATAIDDGTGNSYPGILNNDDLDFIANNTAPVECPYDYQTNYNESGSGSNNGHLASSQCNTDPASISSLIDTQTEAVNVFHYHLQNGDNTRENVTSVTIRRGAGDDVDWSVALGGAILIDENGQSQAGVISADNIAFTSIPHGNGALGDLPGNDDGDDGTYLGKEYALRIWFNTNLGAEAIDIDGKDLEFELSTDDLTNVDRVSFGGNYTTSSTPITTSVTVNVVATEYVFDVQPSDVSATAVMSPPVTLEAIDENGNRDLDYDNVADAVQITSTGSLSPIYATPSVANASDWVNGIGTVSEIVHNAPASGRELNTTGGALTDAPTSTTFEITADVAPPVFLNAYYYDTDGDGDIDEIAVEMGEEIDETTAVAGEFTLGSGSVDDAIFSGPANNPLDATDTDEYFTLQVTVPGTQVTTLGYTQGTLADVSGNLANSNASITTVDVADPVFVAAHFFDAETVNGVIDEVVIEMSEPIEDGTIVPGDFSIDGATPTLDASISNSLDPDVTDDKYFTFTVSLVGTTTFPTSYTAGSLTDVGSNNAASDGSITESDMASPVIINSLSLDTDGNGNTDAIELEFSESVKDITFSLSISDWAVSSDNFVSGLQDDVITGFSSEVTDLAAVDVFDDQYVRLEWNPTNTSGTGAYHLEYTNGGDDITDNSSNLNAIVNLSNQAITDGALPVFLSASTIDDGNGYLDGILVRFSDVIDVAGTLDEDPTGGFDDFSIAGGYTITAVTPVAGAGNDDDEIILTVTEMGSYDTDATPGVTVNGGELDDTDANTIPGATLTAIDNADPVFVSATTADSDSDGQIDEINILFSEDVDAGTIDEISAGGFDDFSVVGYTISAVTPLAGTGVDDNEIVLTITQSGSNDTGATPDVTVNASQVDDLVANTAATATLTSIDGAPILITDATWNDANTVDGNIDQVVLTFSEAVDITDALFAADGFDGIEINGGANVIDLGDYSGDGVTTLTLDFDGSPITGTGISGQTVAYVAAGTNDIIEDGISANEMADATAPINNTDNATPIANTISISSDNATSNTHAVTGNTVTLAFTVDDDFGTDPTVTFKSGGANINNAITVDNSSAPNYEATFDVNSLDTDGLVTFTIDFTDDGGNAGTTVTAVSDATSVTIDKVAPTLVITRNAVTNGSISGTNDNAVSFDLAFSEVIDVANFNESDITLNLGGATADPLAGGDLVDDGDNQNFTLNVSNVGGDGTIDITVSGTGTQDLAGNTLAGDETSESFTIDNTAPTATITRNAVSNGSFTGTNDASVSFDIAFSTPIDNSTFVLGDVTINNPGGVTLGAASLTPDGDDQNYTFTIPVTAGDGDLSISMAAGSVNDAATNGLGSAAASGTITIDNTAPTASNVTITSDNGTNNNQAVTGNTVTLSFTVDDDLTGNPSATFRSGGAVINNSVSIGGSNPNYNASFVVDAADEDGNVTFTLDFTDDAGNSATQVTSVSGTGAGSSVNVDNTIPTLTITRNTPGAGTVNGTNSASVSFDLAFSEVMDAGFDFNDISLDVSGVTADPLAVGNLVDDGGGDYTLTVNNVAGDGTLGITVSGAGSPDPAGNTLASDVTSAVFTIDNTAPTATITRNAVSNGSFTGTNDASVSFDIAFSTPIDNSTFVLGDVTINNPGGVTLGAASLTPDGDDQNYTFTIPVTAGDGDLSISMAAGSVNDAATNGLGSAAASGTITIDNTAPTASNVTISSNNGTNINQAVTGNTVTLSFTVDDDLTGNPSATFRSGGAVINNSVSIGGSNPNYNASFVVDAADEDGNVTFTLDFTDDAGNSATQVTSVSGTGAGSSVNVDNTIPTLTITRNTPGAGTVNGTNSTSVSFDLAFSEVMDAGFDFNDISLDVSGVTADPLAAGNLVDDGGGDYTLTVNNVAGDGTLGITVSGAGSPDPAGNTLASDVTSAVFTIDNTAPTATITRNAVSSGSFAGTTDASISFDISFSTPIDNSTFVLGDVTINNPGGVTLGAASLTPDGDDQNYTFTIPVTAGDGDLSISLAAGSVEDDATNGLGSAATSGIISIDNTAPTASNVTLSSNNGTNADQANTGNTVSLSFTVDDDLTGNPTVAFRSGGVAVAGTVTISGVNPTYTASYVVDAGDRDGNVTFTLDFIDDAGNAATQVTAVSGTGAGTSVNVDNTNPTLTITRNAPGAGTVDGTNSNSVSFDLAFSEVMDAGFDFNDISLDFSGVTADPLAAGNLVDDGGGDYTLTVNNIVGDGTLGITVSGAGSPDLAGNTLVSDVTSDVFTIDNTAPTATITRNAVSSGSFTGTNDASVSFDISFSTTIDNSTFVVGDVTINNPGGVTLGAASLTPDGDDQNYTFTIPVTGGDGDLSISMAVGSIADDATNGLGSAASSGTITIDNTAPTASNVTLSSNNGTNTDQANTGNTVSLSFTVDDDLTGNPTVAFRSGGVSVAGGVTITGANPNYTASYVVDAGDKDGNVTFTLNFTDDAGNAATQVTAVSGTGAGTSVNVDNTIPTLTITRNAPAAGTVDGTNSNSVSFDLAFSEVMDAGFDFSDISLNLSGVTADVLAAGDLVDDGGGDYTLTVSNIIGDGTLGITVSGAGSPDPAGNTLASDVTSSVFTIDNTAPTLQSATANSSTSITITLDDNVQILSNTPGDFIVTDAQGTTFTVTGVSDGTAGDASLNLTVNDFSGSVGDLTVTYASSTSNYADLSTNQLADDATGLLIERNLNVAPSLTENSTGLTEDTASDVAMYRSNTTGVETSTPVDITPNIAGTSTITVYSDAGLSTMVYQETNVTGSVSPTLADFFPSIDFSDGNADHGIYTFYITETATNSADSEGPSAKYSIALLDAVSLSPDANAFSEDNNTGTTLTVNNHPSDQTLRFTGNGLTDVNYGSTTSSLRFVPSSAGSTNSPHDIRLEFENADGETANFIAQTIVVNSANNVLSSGQTTSFCRVDGIEVINVNSNPSGIDTGEDTDTSQQDFYDVEAYYIKNGSRYTGITGSTTGIAGAGNISRIILPYDRNGDDVDDRDDGTLGITAGDPTFAANGIWKIDPSALTDDLFTPSTERADIDTIRLIYYVVDEVNTTVFQQISQVDIYIYPDPVVEITSSNDVVCEDEDPFALTATLNGVSVTVDSYEISLGASSATITGNLFDPANPLGMATAPDDPSGDYEIIYTSDLSDGGNGCTDMDTINIEVLAKPGIKELDTDISGRGEFDAINNIYTIEYCEGETFDDLSITLDGNDEIRWYTNSFLTTELDIVDGNADGSLVTATDFFGISEVQGGEDEDFYYVLVDNLDKGGVCQSDVIQVRFIGHSTPDTPEADLTSSTAGGSINATSVEYNYCVNTGASATIEDIILNPLPATGEAYFTVLAADTVLFAQLTNTTMQFDSLLSDLTAGASYEFEILIVDYDNSFPATEPAEGTEFTGCASDTLTVAINVFEIPSAPVQSEFADNPNMVGDVITYYMCAGEELPDISINPPNGVNEYLYEWSLTRGGSPLTISDNQGDRLQVDDYNNSFGVDVINTPGTYSLYTAINSNVRNDADFTGCTSDTTQVSLIVYPVPGTPTIDAPTNTSVGTPTGGFDYSFNYCVGAGTGLPSNTPFDVTVPSSATAGNDERLIWFTATDDGTAIANANPVAFGTNVTATNLGMAGATNETFEFAVIHNTDLVPGYDEFEGCFSDTVFVQILVSTIPATQFRIDGITAGETTTFSFFDVNASIIATDGVVFEIRDASNALVDGSTQSDLTPAAFSIPTAGRYTASLSITTSAGCEETETREFQVLEKITVTGLYTQDFESSDGGWFAEFQSDDGLTGDLNTPARQSSWAWGAKTNASVPEIVNFSGGADGTSSGWHTNLTGTYQGGEESYVYSPAFDISTLVNPALSMYTFRSLDSSKDGVVMQYSTDDGETWKNIGDYNPANTVPSTGNNWYTENGISSAPGDLTVGWDAGLSTDFNTGDVGWANQLANPDSIVWKESVHALEFDATDDLTNVRFRFALGASGAITDVKEGLGFSFDELTLFQLDRNVLVEQFSSMLSATSRSVNNAIRQSTPNVLAINYFTGISNSGARFDQLNRRSKAGPAARSSYYGIDRVPSSVLDGDLYPQTNSLNWDENDVEIKSIQPTKFLLPLGTNGVRIDNNGADDQRIEASISFVAQNSEPENFDITFHFAVVEKEVLITDILADDPNFDTGVYQNDDTLRNVLRVMLPDAAGFSHKGVVNPGQTFDYTIEWNITDVYAPDELRVIAFVQNRKTKQILQAGWGEVNGKTQLALGLDEQLDDMDIYPNPADQVVTLDFADPIVEETEWVIFDQAGREVLKGQITKGTRTLTIETKDVPSGLYFIYLYAEERKRQSRRVLILH
ncbi:Ig-like domain-containing protein [Ekhidna lutea]|uniref:Ig-like domain-containing protein n=1 Tax=Ekhidna lutea TaxID=447679 RepID=A0A239GHY6_EKHLU|nr:Ig-like domain-containing protein [Ekhidna lutea]SNS68760.1 Ig-like domain-containing protein [Ekhidna lutea]